MYLYIENHEISSIDKDSIDKIIKNISNDIEGTDRYLGTSQDILKKYPDTKTIKFKTISSLIIILNKYEEEVLALRSPSHLKFRDCSKVIYDFVSLLKNVCEKKNLIKDDVNFEDLDIDELIKLLGKFKNLGLFSFFSKDSRETKKIVLELIKHENISKRLHSIF